ncbi:MAG: GtrA family protein [Dysgonamonadaceae bacterium]|jgi:putative flippase GtrA|nr:GtrA family protein [Dysgonamonadaceae bacterium]
MLNNIRKLFTLIGGRIRRIIDFFYPPFARWFSRRLFRYGVCGVVNMGFNWVLYSAAYNFLFDKQLIDVFGLVPISPHIAALLLTFPISLITGFLLQKYVTFSTSQLRGGVQFVRYISVVTLNLLINYAGLKFFVEMLGFWATPSKMVVDIITAIVSYLCQKYFTFRENV